jgi:hypothetical protein
MGLVGVVINILHFGRIALPMYEQKLQLHQYWVHNEPQNSSNSFLPRSTLAWFNQTYYQMYRLFGALVNHFKLLTYRANLYMYDECCNCTNIEFTTRHWTQAILCFNRLNISLIQSNELANVQVVWRSNESF